MATIKAGAYTFNTTLTDADVSANFAFKSNNVNYTGIQYSEGFDNDEFELTYVKSSGIPPTLYTKSGWANEEYRLIAIETDQTVDDTFYAWFTANIEVPRVSVDLTSLTGWDSLSAGTHAITVKAKADEYKDSEASTAVSVEKTSSFTQIQIAQYSGSEYKNVNRLTGLDKNKKYTLAYINNNSKYASSYFYYDTEWKFAEINNYWDYYVLYINGQTDDTIDFEWGESRMAFVGLHLDGACLEGINAATSADFENITFQTGILNYWHCFVEGTLIHMSDGTYKPVEDIRYGDEVKCYDFVNGFKTFAPIDWMIPESVATKYWEIIFSDGSSINLVGANGKSHRIYNLTKQRFDYPQDFKSSDITVKDDGTIVTIISCKEIEKAVKFYNIATKDHINVYANDFLTSNRLNNRYRIENNKFTDEQLMSDDEIEAYKKHLDAIKLK